mmetsp:Transcript_10455/g.20998  ORF Transcript_10455/g.20998 Transcript_10455/m.20998 type:complete len:209 (+) Transcript_10455:2677-3303(+)
MFLFFKSIIGYPIIAIVLACAHTLNLARSSRRLCSEAIFLIWSSFNSEGSFCFKSSICRRTLLIFLARLTGSTTLFASSCAFCSAANFSSRACRAASSFFFCCCFSLRSADLLFPSFCSGAAMPTTILPVAPTKLRLTALFLVTFCAPIIFPSFSARIRSARLPPPLPARFLCDGGTYLLGALGASATATASGPVPRSFKDGDCGRSG